MEALMPQNVEAEIATLGGIIIDPDAITHVDFLKPEHFYRENHRTIYAVIQLLCARRENADLITICNELSSQQKLTEVGGPAYVASLINCVPSSRNVVEYARIVEQKAILRSLIQASGDIAATAYEQGDASVALENAEQLIFKISQSGETSRPVVSHRVALARYMENLMKIHEQSKNGAITGVPTGFKYIDKKLGGLRSPDLIILAARPGVGKTSLALNIGNNAVKQGYNGLFFSMEMAEEQILQRWMAVVAGVDQIKLRDARLEGDEWERVFDANETIRHYPGQLWIDDTCGLSISSMRSKARQKRLESGLDFILVDYLQLGRAQNEDGQNFKDRRLEVEAFCRGLKMLARELHIPVFSLAQLSRAVEQRANKIPQLSDLREAGGIEADADIVMFIHKDAEIDKDATEYDVSIIIEKHRNGPTGIIPLHFVAAQTRYHSVRMEDACREK